MKSKRDDLWEFNIQCVPRPVTIWRLLQVFDIYVYKFWMSIENHRYIFSIKKSYPLPMGKNIRGIPINLYRKIFNDQPHKIFYFIIQKITMIHCNSSWSYQKCKFPIRRTPPKFIYLTLPCTVWLMFSN